MREGPRLLGLGAACAAGLAGMFQPPEAGAVDVDSPAYGCCRGGGCTAMPPRPCNETSVFCVLHLRIWDLISLSDALLHCKSDRQQV